MTSRPQLVSPHDGSIGRLRSQAPIRPRLSEVLLTVRARRESQGLPKFANDRAGRLHATPVRTTVSFGPGGAYWLARRVSLPDFQRRLVVLAGERRVAAAFLAGERRVAAFLAGARWAGASEALPAAFTAASLVG
jgi:hypothetical protein